MCLGAVREVCLRASSPHCPGADTPRGRCSLPPSHVFPFCGAAAAPKKLEGLLACPHCLCLPLVLGLGGFY